MSCLSVVNGEPCPNPPTHVAFHKRWPIGPFCPTCVNEARRLARVYHSVRINGRMYKAEGLSFNELEAE